MAPPSLMKKKKLVLLALCASLLFAAASAQKYNAVYSFGDSITDTGNLCTNGRPSAITFTQPPYGETYFGKPTCRCSDGRVIVDFLSDRFGLPFLPPSKSTSADFKKGANMAITGATAMDAPFFRSLGLSDKIWNNGPISFQIQWFQQITSAVCGSSCKSYLSSSLLVFGEFGGNDYNAMLFGNYNTDQASTYTPQIISTIGDGVEKLIGAGRDGHRGAGGAPHRLLPHLPHHLRHLQRRRLRRARLPQEVQRPLHQPQQPAAEQDLQPAEQVQVGADHVRRLLLRRARHGQEPSKYGTLLLLSPTQTRMVW
ncbi:hypothetical protein ACQ4PT_054892 [Festuca glaucescens]